MNNDIGFIILKNNSVNTFEKLTENLSSKEVSKIKEILQHDINKNFDYSNNLAYINILEEDFFTQIDLVKYFLSDETISYANVMEYFFYKEYSFLFNEYWFLKPAYFLTNEEIGKLIRANGFFDEFLNNSLSSSSYFHFLSNIDLNYDYFLIDNINEQGMINSLSHIDCLGNIFISERNNIQLLIKRWR